MNPASLASATCLKYTRSASGIAHPAAVAPVEEPGAPLGEVGLPGGGSRPAPAARGARGSSTLSGSASASASGSGWSRTRQGWAWCAAAGPAR